MKLTKLELQMLLQFTECNRDCDADCARVQEYVPDYFFGMTETQVKRHWNKLIKKLKTEFKKGKKK